MEIELVVRIAGLAVLPFVLGEDPAALTYESYGGWCCVAAEPAGLTLLIAVAG
ncbi:hypothetical protein [Paenarthrobacter nitroguajacolicus]|uniref:hypothetical protein n=1 Tax=Paenarthrobacter nitroguajacolicus TaxID=211146 RepID=UPI0015B9DFA3|nr:hypothetical protein [Paenarthrobacter nitroguajacolicus]